MWTSTATPSGNARTIADIGTLNQDDRMHASVNDPPHTVKSANAPTSTTLAATMGGERIELDISATGVAGVLILPTRLFLNADPGQGIPGSAISLLHFPTIPKLATERRRPT
ncbi:unnamed protein product [Peniophora sp. CBMAI 1063]|nr:unnamed protein product [Peniophora sp. CBMAI 1063]